MTDTIAEGCCSARTPCSHQCKDPSTICDACRAASLSVIAWLAEQEKEALAKMGASSITTASIEWHRAQAAAFKRAHAYAVARPDRYMLPPSPVMADDLAYLAGLAISSKDKALARIAAALLLAR